MNKSELIKSMASKANLTQDEAGKALDAFCESVTETLAKGDGISLIGFGAFTVAARAARTGRNPRTGEPLQIAAATLPKFKAGQKLKDAVNK